MRVLYEGPLWGSSIRVFYEGLLWGSSIRVFYKGLLWGSSMRVLYEGPLWWSSIRVFYEGPLWGSSMRVFYIQHGFPRWRTALRMNPLSPRDWWRGQSGGQIMGILWATLSHWTTHPPTHTHTHTHTCLSFISSLNPMHWALCQTPSVPITEAFCTPTWKHFR